MESAAIEGIQDIPNSKLDDLGLESLEFMELIMELEDVLGVVVSDDLIDPELTVAEFSDLIVANNIESCDKI